MATDHAAAVESEPAADGETAYITPTADFVIIATMTTIVAVASAAVIIP